MIQKKFTDNAVKVLSGNPEVLGLAAGGSWITGEIDEYSDIDLIVVTSEKISDDTGRMKDMAGALGNMISSFTGEHVGERRLLICLFDSPLLHVDIKFLVPDEFHERVEDPVILWERGNCLSDIINTTESEWPGLDFQWIEDRFWTWVHYALLKLGRGEVFEALDFLSYLRVNVTAPLLQIKNGKLPRGLRKVESFFPRRDLDSLAATVPGYSLDGVFTALENTVNLYRNLRDEVFPESVRFDRNTEAKVMKYFYDIRGGKTDA